jgi:cystathionine beta-lyase family protein involved in aluminum resistance
MCFEKGKFLTPSEVDTAKKMQHFCMQEMKKVGMNRFFAWLATRSIPKLERWKN